MERAYNFTNKYLDILENTLHVENVDEGNPTFIPSRINHFTISRLISELNDLRRSSELLNAITDIQVASKEKQNLFTTGVGYSPDFLNFVKLGLLIGNKVVLWDTLLPNIINEKDGIDLDYLGVYLYNILSLKKLAHKGGLIYLPHPSFWNDRSRYYYQAISTINNVPSELIGFINSWSLLQEGFKLNPYLMSTPDSNTYLLHQQFLNKESLYPQEKLSIHNDIYELIRYNKFNYLSESSVDDFFDVLNKNNDRYEKLKNSLYQELEIPKHLTETEKKQYISNVFIDLNEGIEKQNKTLTDNKINNISIAARSIGAVGSLIAATLSPESTIAIISLFSGFLGASSTLISLSRSLMVKPNTSVFYQVFNEIKDKTEIKKDNEFIEQERKRRFNLE